MIRSALLVTVGVAITAFMSFWAVIFSFFPNADDRVHKIAQLWGKLLLLICDTKVEVIGKENFPYKNSHVLMANHQSDFDILIALAHLPGQFRWLAKKELFNIPIFGTAMKSAGYISIDRQNREMALQNLEEAALRVRNGKSLMTFPEGTRSRDGEIKAFKQGSFFVAIKSGVPIIPITIIGSGQIMPKKSLRIRPGKIRLIIDKPVETKKYTEENRRELIDKIRNIIIKNFDEWREAGTASIKDIEKENS
jgi:1-acyl-sn-glycerol-3-phosphate acyltransferase